MARRLKIKLASGALLQVCCDKIFLGGNKLATRLKQDTQKSSKQGVPCRHHYGVETKIFWVATSWRQD